MQFIRIAALLCAAALAAMAQGNRPDRIEWLRDQGFGMFIHWNVDGQLGGVISHSMVGAGDQYLRRFIVDLPKTFNPRKFYPQDWAVLARLAGMKYVVFTTKHHAGFCMWDTATTDYNVMQTPFRRDITGELLQAFREQGVAPGIYFSPDDFWWLYKNGRTLQRGIPDVQPSANPGLMAHDKAQVKELLTKYGPIDIVFFDGEAEGLKQLAWEIRPETIVTRGEIQTPEQYIPGIPLEGPWEANLTMGTEWPYKPTNETYKSGGQLISMLIETRAKGGNLLLNVGPKPDGELPVEQEDRLREVALWMWVNGEGIYGVRPWVITNEQDYWFTKKKGEDTLYVFVKQNEPWKFAEWKDITLHSVQATDATQASILSQNDKVAEYRPGVVPKTTWKQDAGGLHVRAMRAQRLYTNYRWPNPVVIKLTHVKPALVPPRVETVRVRWNSAGRTAVFEGRLIDLGKSAALDVGFEYRSITGQDTHERTAAWKPAGMTRLTAPGGYTIELKNLKPGERYEYRAVVKHPLLSLYGGDKNFEAK